MGFSLSQRGARLLLFGSLVVIALVSGARLIRSDPVPWGWIVAFTAGSFILVGPVTWLFRDNIPKQQRERLRYIASGIALLCVPIVIGLGLVFGNLLIFLDAGAFGGLVGFAIALLIEQLFVPERLRGIAQ